MEACDDSEELVGRSLWTLARVRMYYHQPRSASLVPTIVFGFLHLISYRALLGVVPSSDLRSVCHTGYFSLGSDVAMDGFWNLPVYG